MCAVKAIMKQKAGRSLENTSLSHSKTSISASKFFRHYGAVLPICILLISGILITQQACTGAVPAETSEGGEIAVPVKIESTANIGSIYFEVVYSSMTLEATGVENGTIATDAMFEYSIDAHDRVIMGFIDSNGFQGNGTLATISLQVLRADENDLPLRIDNIVAHSATTVAPLEARVSEGSINTSKESFKSPLIHIGTGD